MKPNKEVLKNAPDGAVYYFPECDSYFDDRWVGYNHQGVKLEGDYKWLFEGHRSKCCTLKSLEVLVEPKQGVIFKCKGKEVLFLCHHPHHPVYVVECSTRGIITILPEDLSYV